MPVDVFQKEYGQLVNDETRDETHTMIGTMFLAYVDKALAADR